MKAPKCVKTNVERLLEAAGVPYVAHSFDGREGAADAEEIAAQLGVPAASVFKTLVTRSERNAYYVFAIPADARLDLKKAAKAAGEKALEMLPLAKLFPLTGYRHGGCSPLGMRKSFPTFIDGSARQWPRIFISAGQIGLNLEVAPEPFAKLVPAVFSPLVQDSAAGAVLGENRGR